MSEKFEGLSQLHPNEFVRKYRGPKHFGLKDTQLEDAIKKGLIPPTQPVYPGSRAEGWTGQVIIDHHRRMAELAKIK